MSILYFLLTAAVYGCLCASYDFYQIWQPMSRDERPDLPQNGAIKAPKPLLSGGIAGEAIVESDGSVVSQVP
jgi:hypothetical protein